MTDPAAADLRLGRLRALGALPALLPALEPAARSRSCSTGCSGRCSSCLRRRGRRPRLGRLRRCSPARGSSADPRRRRRRCIAVNWGVYISAVNHGHVVEAALGYFINPLVTVLLGVVVLRERLRRAAVGGGRRRRAGRRRPRPSAYGRPPWIALILALSFGLYGLVKKQVGAAVGALASLTTETLVLAPVAVVGAGLARGARRGPSPTTRRGRRLLLASAGVATAVPLLLFAAAARRVPLGTIGLLQFITPVLQLLVRRAAARRAHERPPRGSASRSSGSRSSCSPSTPCRRPPGAAPRRALWRPSAPPNAPAGPAGPTPRRSRRRRPRPVRRRRTPGARGCRPAARAARRPRSDSGLTMLSACSQPGISAIG